MSTIVVVPGTDSGLSEDQQNALDVLENLSFEQFNQMKEFLDLGDPGVLGPETLQAFLSKGQAEGVDFSNEGIEQFKSDQNLGNTGVLQGVIGPQTASLLAALVMGQNHPAEPGELRQISDAGIALIKEFESFARLIPGRPGYVEAYLDSVGVPTIGWGHTRGVSLGMVIDSDQAEADLKEDLAASEASVGRYVKVDLTDNQFAALVSFVFNVGASNFASSTLLRKLNSGDFAGAATEFPRWNKAGGEVLPGLVKRRAAEQKLFLSQ